MLYVILLVSGAALALLAWLQLRGKRAARPASVEDTDDAPEDGGALPGRRRGLGTGLVTDAADLPPPAPLIHLAAEDAGEPEIAEGSPQPDAELRVAETMSMVLRRQIPVRFDEAPRSWLGGLPMMPADLPWPTSHSVEHPEHGETPLHFLAQIACEDLPDQLWGGLGPRHGWLLFFLDAQEFDVTENREAIRVLHIDQLGPERTPPAGIQPMRDEEYTGYNYDFLRSAAEIPAVWRRWPVDLLATPNEPIPDMAERTITPERFADMLYDDAAVDHGPGRLHPAAIPPARQEWPFTWRGALYVIDSVARVLAKTREVQLSDRDRETVFEPGWIEAALASIEGRREAISARLGTPGDGTARNEMARLDEMRDTLLAGGAPIAPEKLVERMTSSIAGYNAWRQSRRPVLARLRDEILQHDLDGAMPADAFRPMLETLAAERCTYWTMVRNGGHDRSLPTPVTISLDALARDGFAAALYEVAADLYVASPEKRALIPPHILAKCEPFWRRLDGNRPHRMGGMHDGVQSEPQQGSQARLLLLQLASDDAMQWCWGDAGAWYFWIDADRLAAGDFSSVIAELECH